MAEKLTAAGLQWAMIHGPDSRIAWLALELWAGRDHGWFEEFQAVVIRIANDEGERLAAAPLEQPAAIVLRHWDAPDDKAPMLRLWDALTRAEYGS